MVAIPLQSPPEGNSTSDSASVPTSTPASVQTTTNANAGKTLAIVSLVAGIAGIVIGLLTFFGLIASVAAVVTGHLSTRREPMAGGIRVAGLVTGYLGLVLNIIVIGLLLLGIALIAN